MVINRSYPTKMFQFALQIRETSIVSDHPPPIACAVIDCSWGAFFATSKKGMDSVRGLINQGSQAALRWSLLYGGFLRNRGTPKNHPFIFIGSSLTKTIHFIHFWGTPHFKKPPYPDAPWCWNIYRHSPPVHGPVM